MCHICMFLLYFEVFCDLLLNKRSATWNRDELNPSLVPSGLPAWLYPAKCDKNKGMVAHEAIVECVTDVLTLF